MAAMLSTLGPNMANMLPQMPSLPVPTMPSFPMGGGMGPGVPGMSKAAAGLSLVKYVAILAVAVAGFVYLGKTTNLGSCREGYKNVAGVCWGKCPDNTKDVLALCREKCRTGYKDTAGVCWFDKCPPGQEKQGARCYEPCPSNTKKVGCCLCREKCRSGFREVLGVCWKGLRSYVPKTRPRKSDGKLLSYVPRTTAKKSYVNKLGVIGAFIFPVLAILIGLKVLRLVLPIP